DEEAEQDAKELLEEVSPIVADDLEISLWASEKLLADPVALHVDHKGRVLVTVTGRRRSGEIDIRGHRDWMIESIAMESPEDRRDFLHKELSTEKSAENSWLSEYVEDGSQTWRDLEVNKESIYRLEDLTGNGHANRSSRFIHDFHEEITNVAGAVLYHQDDVFLGVSPDLWRITDTNNDGFANEKESISHGYGVHIGFGGHDMSGLTLGPDGRIYWSIGDVGLNVTDDEGKNWYYPNEGAIMRSEPDGSNFEVFASGLRNTHEFTFDKFGNLITIDNDGDHAGEFERLVYLINGSDSGWRINWQFGKYTDPKNNEYKVWMEEDYYKPRFENQAAHILPPLARYHDGPAGMTYNPGTALNEKWKDHFFVTEFPGSASQSAIHAFSLKESGASFELDRDEKIMQGILATGMEFGPDGALYFADWIDGWAKKGKGRIWKLDAPGDAESPIRIETKDLLAEEFNNRSSDELLQLLKHEDMRVRKKAQFELVDRNDAEIFLKALEQRDHQLARIHGAWGLAQIGRKDPEAVKPLINYLDDADPEVRAQAAKMLGDVRYEPSGEDLIPLLKDDNPRVQFFAAEALGRISYAPAMGPIVEMLRENDDEDVYLRHVGAIALERIGNTEAVIELADDPSQAVRIAAVVALRRLQDPGVARFLNDEDEYIVTNAARAINDDAFITDALPALARMLDQDQFINEPLIRRAINANLYSGTSENAERLMAFAMRKDVSEELRVEALNTISNWSEPSLLDRVTGMYRGEVVNNPEDGRNALEPVFTTIMESANSAVKVAVLEAASSLEFKKAIPEIFAMIDTAPSIDVRIASLNALMSLDYAEIAEAVNRALIDEEPSVRMNALSKITNLGLPAEETVSLIETTLNNGATEELQTAIKTLGRIDAPASHEVLDRQLNRLIEGSLPQEVQLDLLLAVEETGSGPLQEKLLEYQSKKTQDGPLSAYKETLYGGNADKGLNIIESHEGAQCMRCHAIGGEGSDVGPGLASIGERLTREQLLLSLVNPSERIAPGYGAVSLTLNDGDTVQGALSAETDTHITVSSGGEKQEIIKTAISEQTNSPSAMPPMGDVLTRTEIRDLVEYLTTLRDGPDSM
ncbi:MAG: HEAT repeat domain-containing protein, partial [Balneolales bacterium]